MSIDPQQLQIVSFPEPILRQTAEPVETIDATVQQVAERMLELMNLADGIGLAAPQVGLPWRMFVTAASEGEPERVFINPRLSDFNETTESAEEGCLSLPDVRVQVVRPIGLTITAQDVDGREFSLTSDSLYARVWQHEFDHLEGILIIDKMSPMERLANRRALKNLKAAAR